MRRRRLGLLVKSFGLGTLVAVTLIAGAPPQALAQQDLAREIDVIKRSLADLQRF